MHLKTVERAHTPKNLWEKIKLPKNFAEALETVEKHMEFWPEHKARQNSALGRDLAINLFFDTKSHKP